MKTPVKIAVIGAGGIGCALAPILSRMFPIVLVDADNYEPGNVGRQFPALHSTENKARVLRDMIANHTTHPVEHIESYVKDLFITSHPEWAGVDFIIAGVDNNASRRIIAGLGNDLDIPVILAGNGHSHGEAHLAIPGIYSPFDFFDFPDGDPAPWSCNSDKQLEEHPQTAIANALASGAALHLLLSWQKVANPLNAVVFSRSDSLCSSYSRAKDLLAAGKAA